MQKGVSDLAHRVDEGGGGGLREENKEGGVKKMIADVLLDDLILINPTNK